jgi:hypothetical protein
MPEKNKNDYIEDQLPTGDVGNIIRQRGEPRKEQNREESQNDYPVPDRQMEKNDNQSKWNTSRLALRKKAKEAAKSTAKENIKKAIKKKAKKLVLRWIAALGCSTISVPAIVIAVVIIIVMILALWCNENKTTCAWEFLKMPFN